MISHRYSAGTNTYAVVLLKCGSNTMQDMHMHNGSRLEGKQRARGRGRERFAWPVSAVALFAA
ncbi:hypothetical protein C2E23DRAFT_554522 [Lenzites betulinus]|nr:hypothetical protein C2E23DRAFT_554522 [Lenzites betulinus]